MTKVLRLCALGLAMCAMLPGESWQRMTASLSGIFVLCLVEIAEAVRECKDALDAAQPAKQKEGE